MSFRMQASYQPMVTQAHRQVALVVAVYGLKQMASMALELYRRMVVRVGTAITAGSIFGNNGKFSTFWV